MCTAFYFSASTHLNFIEFSVIGCKISPRTLQIAMQQQLYWQQMMFSLKLLLEHPNHQAVLKVSSYFASLDCYFHAETIFWISMWLGVFIFYFLSLYSFFFIFFLARFIYPNYSCSKQWWTWWEGKGTSCSAERAFQSNIWECWFRKGEFYYSRSDIPFFVRADFFPLSFRWSHLLCFKRVTVCRLGWVDCAKVHLDFPLCLSLPLHKIQT